MKRFCGTILIVLGMVGAASGSRVEDARQNAGAKHSLPLASLAGAAVLVSGVVLSAKREMRKRLGA